MQTKKQLAAKDGFWTVKSSRTVPKPFPGAYPTRWRLVIWDENKVHVNYFGKPNPRLIAKIKRIAGALEAGTMYLAEVDRGGAFRVVSRGLPFAVPYTLTAGNSVLQYYYYPWVDAREFFAPWLLPCWSKRLVSKRKRVYSTYSPFRKMFGVKEQELREFFTWANANAAKSKSSKK